MSSAVTVEKLDTSGLLCSVDGNEKNSRQLCCERCSSKILPPNMGTYEDAGSEFELHIMKKKTDESQSDKEKISQFYRVDDMFDFDNVGFSKTVDDTTKFLTCADCEIGPIGYQDLKTSKCYVALCRVKHEEKK